MLRNRRLCWVCLGRLEDRGSASRVLQRVMGFILRVSVVFRFFVAGGGGGFSARHLMRVTVGDSVHGKTNK